MKVWWIAGGVAVLSVGLGMFLLALRGARSARETSARLDALSSEVSGLRSEIAELKAREAGAVRRDAILEVVAADRIEEKRRRDEEHEQRFSQLSLAYAERAAQKFDLTEDQRKGLLEILMSSGKKLEAMEAQMIVLRNAGDLDSWTKATDEVFQALKAWRSGELTRLLGADIAGRVNEDELGLLGDAGRLEASRQDR